MKNEEIDDTGLHKGITRGITKSITYDILRMTYEKINDTGFRTEAFRNEGDFFYASSQSASIWEPVTLRRKALGIEKINDAGFRAALRARGKRRLNAPFSASSERAARETSGFKGFRLQLRVSETNELTANS